MTLFILPLRQGILPPPALIALPADTRRRISVGLTLVHRRRRWTNGKPTLTHRLVSAALSFDSFADFSRHPDFKIIHEATVRSVHFQPDIQLRTCHNMN